jgi:hypothetical protein
MVAAKKGKKLRYFKDKRDKNLFVLQLFHAIK